jgi:putative transposase
VTFWQRQAQVCQQGQRDRQDVYALIQANQADLSIQTMCKHLQVSTSGYYEWCSRQPSMRCINERIMIERIRPIHVMSDGTYGRARVQAELREMGLRVNHKRIERWMKLAHLQCVNRRRGIG